MNTSKKLYLSEPATGAGVNEERMNGSRPASASDWGAQ